jgi:hypothetical protein
MARVAVAGDTLSIEIEGLDRLWSLKSRLEIPLQHVRGATADPGIAREHHGWRGPGAYVPGVLSAGTFHQDGKRVFWDVHDPAKVIVIELADEHFQRLVVEVDDPEATATAIGKAIGGRSR